MALATHWTQIVRAAREHAAGLYYEASVCGAVPIIRAINGSLQANRISSVMGIINGTTNYILTRMANEGAAYADVLADAQRLGLAEPDPTADVEGYDAAYKLSILSTLAFHRHVPVENVYREGITGITPLDVQCGKEFGLTLKLLAVAKEENGEIQARVHPTFVPNSHPLANVNDAFNAVFVKGRDDVLRARRGRSADGQRAGIGFDLRGEGQAARTARGERSAVQDGGGLALRALCPHAGEG